MERCFGGGAGKEEAARGDAVAGGSTVVGTRGVVRAKDDCWPDGTWGCTWDEDWE